MKSVFGLLSTKNIFQNKKGETYEKIVFSKILKIKKDLSEDKPYFTSSNDKMISTSGLGTMISLHSRKLRISIKS